MLGRLAAALALLAVLAAPAAVAQANGPPLLLQVRAPTAPIKPQVESPTMDVDVTLACDALVQHASADAGTNEAGAAVDVVLQGESGVLFTGPTSLVFPVQDCTTGQPGTTRTLQVQVGIPRTAPGLQPLAAMAKAVLRPGPAPGSAASEATAPFTVTADYYGVNQVKAEQKLRACSPCRDAPIEMQVTNFGNARTVYTFALATQLPAGWSVTLPGPIALDRAATSRGTTATATLHVTGGHGQIALAVVAKPAAADDPGKAGAPMTLNLQVRDESLLSRAAPAPGPLLPLALLALAAVAVRRRR
jgi:hypothetical protein